MRSLDPKIVDGKMGFVGRMPGHVYRMGSPKVPTSASGTSLTLSSAAAPLTALTLYGKSEQRTTTGAQLFDANKMVYNGAFAQTVINDITNARTAVIPIDPGAEYSISRGNLEGNFFRFVQTSFNGDITKLSDITSDTFIDGTFFDYSSFSERTIIANSSAKYLLIYLWSNVSEYTLEDILSVLMVNAGATALPWEPYTGGVPSPSPDYPQEIKSVGDSGTINVTLSDGGSQSQTLPVQTPNGLPGIPVSSGGNYTDASGQQWVCDEVDFERGVYVQRMKEISDIAWMLHTGYTVDGSELFAATNITDGLQLASTQNSAYCSKLIRDNRVLNLNTSGFYQSYGRAFARIKDIGDIDSFLELMQGAVILYQLETPVETPLSPSDIAAYSALRTYSPTTVVSNNAGAWMKVGYYSYGAIERLVRWAESAERK